MDVKMTLSDWLGKRSVPRVAPRRDQLATNVTYLPRLAGLRLAAVGDIHGRADLLADLHQRLDLESDGAPAPIEIYLGDYVDRGAHSHAVIDALIARSHDRQVVFLMGNHERMMLRALEDPGSVMLWLQNGGDQTLRSYGVGSGDVQQAAQRDPALICRVLGEIVPADHVAFLRSLHLSFSIGGFLFVHAGIRPGVPLPEQREEDCLWIRDDFLNSTADHGVVVVHGHTPVQAPQFLRNRINLDTGAVFTGVLTCLMISDAELRLV
jgi:serine/threonine protein phosphatase 1